MRETTGSFTLPGEAGYEELTLKLAKKWGADVIRDSDGTVLSDEITKAGYGIYSTICIIRDHNEWAKKHPDKLLPYIDRWLMSDHPYTVRFGVLCLMNLYLNERFRPEYADKVAAVQSDAYYVNMMRAWYFATALAKQYDAVLPYIEENRLDPWTHNKAIQKAIESFRVTDEHKAHLKTLKRKA